MVLLNDVVHFRGETVALYTTCKYSTGESAGEIGLLDPNSPTVHVEYATPSNQLIVILPPTSMTRMTNERYFYNWIIPDNAPMTTYNVVYEAIIDEKLIKSTEELIVGNPALTTKQNYLRYGPTTFLVRSRTYEPRISPQLPKGMF